MALSGQTEFKQLETPKEKEIFNHKAIEDGETESVDSCMKDGMDVATGNNFTAAAKGENHSEVKEMEVDQNDVNCSKSSVVKNDNEPREFRRTLRSQTKANMEKENENLSSDRLMKKLGLDSVQHIALQSHSVQEATLKMNGNVKVSDGIMLHNEGGNCVNKVLEDVKDAASEGKSEANSRSSTPVSYDDVDMYEPGGQSKKIKDQKVIVENFKAELRTEEAKLIFLRKLLEAQLSKKNGHSNKTSMKDGKVLMPSFQMRQNKPQSIGNSSGTNQSGHVQIAPKIALPPRTMPTGASVPKVVPSIVSGGTGKPPITQSSNYTTDSSGSRSKYGLPHSGSNSQNIAPATTSGVQQKYYIQVGNQLLPASGPPPTNRSVYTIQSYNSSTTAVTTTTANMSSASSSIVPPKASTVSTQESKQTAAKAALRRQLEQTLLQIPPPKPPPADWNAIPNVNSMDFMMLVGLDEIVDDLLAAEGKPTMVQALVEMMPSNPRVCSQCSVDFSPSWRVKAGSTPESFLCEKCSTMNVKKELKAEHTSRLKAAFLKALKQEQEIEEKIKAGEDVHIGTPAASEKQEAAAPGPAIHHPQHVHSVHQPYKHHSSSQNVDHHHQVIHHRHHQVVQHYPRHTPLVHQLHQQHLQQQQMEIESTMRRGSSSSSASSGSSRWHPYISGHHHSSHVHGSSRHGQRSYIPGGEGRHEYYVVHHPQHSNIRWNR